MKAVLLVVSWLNVGPHVSMTELHSEASCRTALRAAGEMLQRQSTSNLTGPHRPLLFDRDPTPGVDDWVLRTATIGREVVRLRCIAADQPP